MSHAYFCGASCLDDHGRSAALVLRTVWHRRARPDHDGSGDRPSAGLWLCRDAKRHSGSGRHRRTAGDDARGTDLEGQCGTPTRGAASAVVSARTRPVNRTRGSEEVQVSDPSREGTRPLGWWSWGAWRPWRGAWGLWRTWWPWRAWGSWWYCERGGVVDSRRTELFLCFRRARVNLDFPWPTVILMKATR
jgi:hypothetical protein